MKIVFLLVINHVIVGVYSSLSEAKQTKQCLIENQCKCKIQIKERIIR